jgi:hexosaminidase
MTEVLRAARTLQEALAAVGPWWELTASASTESDVVRASIAINPHYVPHAEGYKISIEPNLLSIVAADEPGVFYAAVTMRQIAEQCAGTGRLPCLRIDDWPDFPSRGVMHDISKDKIPTLETLFGLVDMLAGLKVNQFQLHTENAFAYRSHRAVWADGTPVTGDDIFALDEYCRERHVDLVANQNSFGHFERWFEHAEYKPLAEAPEGAVDHWGMGKNVPYSLCATDSRSVDFLRGLYDDLLPHFSSDLFNVGCDETDDLGLGRSKEACDERGKGRVYLEFLNEVSELVRSHGRTVLFWDDIIVWQHPELIRELPADVIALEWGYQADHPFAENAGRLADAGVPFYVCPGTSTWNTFAGRTDNAMANMLNAAEAGRSLGAVGYLNTDWGDHGHWQYLPVAYLGLAYGAALSWSIDANRDIDIARALDVHVFKDQAAVMGKLAYALGDTDKIAGLKGPTTTGSAFAEALIFRDVSDRHLRAATLTHDTIAKAQNHIEEVMAPISQASMARDDASLIKDEYLNAAALMRHAGHMIQARLDAGGAIESAPTATKGRLASELEPLIEEHRRLWMSRNRSGGLNDSAGRLERWLVSYRG